MKLTAVLLTIAFLNVSAKGLSQTITMSGRDLPLKQVFAIVEKQTGYVVVYNKGLLDQARPVSLTVNAMPLADMLNMALRDQPMEFMITDNTIVLSRKAQARAEWLPPALPPVSGNVLDPEGIPLPGATVKIRGQATGTVTDQYGYFSIQARTGDILIITFVGFKPKEVRVTAGRLGYILLEPASGKLQEVEVVYNTGYQSVPRERSAGAFSRVSGEQLQLKSNSMNIIDRLEGLVPGLAVNYGAESDKFLVRGATTVNLDRNPLYVVDGVPIYDYASIASLINPADVDNITILKDATAASIWGSQAANGVVVVATKKGKQAPNKIKVNYSGFVSFRGLPDYGYQKMMSSAKFIQTAREVFATDGYPDAYPLSIVSGYGVNNTLPVIYPHELIQYGMADGSISQAEGNRKLDSLAALNNRGQIEQYLMQPALLTNHSVSFSGGGPVYGFYGSLAYTNEQHTDRSGKDRYQLNLRQDFQFSPAIHFDLTTNLAYDVNKPFLLSDLPYGNDTYLPYALFRDGAGNPLSQAYLKMYTPFRQTAEARSGISLDYVPLNEPGYTGSKDNTFSARVNAGLSVRLFRHLQYEGRAQYQRGIGDGYTYYDQRSYQVRLENTYFTAPAATPGGTPVYYLPTTGGHFTATNANTTAWTIRNQLTYDNMLGTDHQLTVLAGTEVRNNLSSMITSSRRGYDFQTQTYFLYDEKMLSTTGVANPVLLQLAPNRLSSTPLKVSENESRFFSLYGNLAYAYKGRYNLNGSIRMDQSNLFGTSKSVQYKPIWSAGISWQVSRESFFHSELFSRLALRATYGLAGNSPRPGQGGPYDVLLANTNALYNGLGTGYLIYSPANKELVWERTATKNLGIDFAVLKGRISGSIDIYDKRTTDLLGDRPTDPTSGWYAAYGNLGDLYNKGVELSVNTANISGRNFSWRTVFNLAYNNNKVTLLKYRNASLSAIRGGFREGYAAYSLFAYRYAGLDADGNPQVYKTSGEIIKSNSDVNVNDGVYTGTTQPLWYGGMTNILAYRHFTFSFLLVYNLGNRMRRDVNQFYSGRLNANIPDYFDQRWKVPGDEAHTDVPKYIPNTSRSQAERDYSFYSYADKNVISAAYVRLRDATLSYDFDGSVLNRWRMERIRVYAQLNNLLLWANNRYDIDPEYYNLSAGTRTARMKPFITLGLNVGF